MRLMALNTSRLAKVLARELEEKHNGGASWRFPNLVTLAARPEGFCSQLRSWQGRGLGCSEIGQEPLPTQSPPPVVPAHAVATAAPSAPSHAGPHQTSQSADIVDTTSPAVPAESMPA